MEATMFSGADAHPRSWSENYLGMLVAPLQTMRELAALNQFSLTGLGGATMAVIVPCALDGLRMSPPSNPVFGLITVPTSVIIGLTMWLTLAGLLSLLGSIFGCAPARCRRVFVLTGWAYAPWILMAPIYCYRDALGIWFSLLAVIPFGWMFILQMLAVKESFELKSAQMLLLFFAVPALYLLLQVLQMVQGFYVSITSIL